MLVAFDTSTRMITVAVATTPESILELTTDAAENGPPHHAEIITPALEQLCRESGVRLRDAEVVAVGIGPGTFTGLRVGIVTAKTLAATLGIPVVAVSSLELRARSQRDVAAAVIVPVFDARRHEVYWSAFRAGDHTRLTSDAIATPDALRAALVDLAADHGAVRLIGDGALRFSEPLGGIEDVAPARADDGSSRASVLAALAFERLARADTVTAAELEPVYLRASDAELAADGAGR